MSDKTDFEKVAELCVQMSNIHQNITKLVWPENDAILKHLAASSVHLALFMRDLADIKYKIKTEISNEKKFLEECGCDFNKEK